MCKGIVIFVCLYYNKSTNKLKGGELMGLFSKKKKQKERATQQVPTRPTGTVDEEKMELSRRIYFKIESWKEPEEYPPYIKKTELPLKVKRIVGYEEYGAEHYLPRGYPYWYALVGVRYRDSEGKLSDEIYVEENIQVNYVQNSDDNCPAFVAKFRGQRNALLLIGGPNEGTCEQDTSTRVKYVDTKNARYYLAWMAEFIPNEEGKILGYFREDIHEKDL